MPCCPTGLGPGDLEREFRDRVAAVVASPWRMASAEDLKWASIVSGTQRSPLARLQDRYLSALQDASTRDPVVAGAFAGVALMLSEPSTLMRPHVLGRVARHRIAAALRRRAVVLRETGRTATCTSHRVRS